METVVYKAQSGDVAGGAADWLRDRGLHPRIVDSLQPRALPWRGPYMIRVAVPDDEVARAHEFLREYEASLDCDVSEHVGELGRQLRMSAQLGALAALLYALLLMGEDATTASRVSWFIGLTIAVGFAVMIATSVYYRWTAGGITKKRRGS